MANTDLTRPSLVYVATNLVNGKQYVGVTTEGRLGRRVYEHRTDAKRHGKKNNNKFYNAIRKYGIENFFFEAVEHYPTMSDGFVAEMRLIAEMNPAYNSTKGGEHPRVSSLNLTEQQRESISARHRGNKYRLGKTHTPEVREKLQRAAIANPVALTNFGHLGPKALAKAVVCLNDGSTHGSASAAARFYGVDKNVVIQVCNRSKKYLTTGNDLVFRYFGDHHGGNEEVAEVISNRRILMKEVICITDGSIVSSVMQAAKKYGLARMTLHRHCEDGRPLKNGLSFKYVEETN